MASVCGRDCQTCGYREKNHCGGCLETEGTPFYGKCQIPSCCHSRGMLSCADCKDSADCGWGAEMEARRAGWQAQQEAQQQIDAAQRAAVRENAVVLARWLPVMFWISIVSGINSLLQQNIQSRGLQITLSVTGLVVSIISLFIYWKFSKLSSRFHTVWVLELISIGISLVLLLLSIAGSAAGANIAGALESGWIAPLFLLSLCMAGLGLFTLYQFFEAMAEQLDPVDHSLAHNWRLLRNWMLGTIGVMVGCVLLAVVLSILALILLFLGALALIGCGIAQLVLLWKSAAFFRVLAEEPALPSSPIDPEEWTS